jgi:Leucine-rich repeat (LRR) protein
MPPPGLRTLLFCATLNCAAGAVRERDRDALWELYSLTGGASWKFNRGWSPGGDPCALSARWVGVGCMDPCDQFRDGQTCALGRVSSLVLDQNDLIGDLSNWTGVGMLTNLTIMDLSLNSLAGTLPTQIGRVEHLHSLNLLRSGMQGTLPTELGELNSRTQVPLHEINIAQNAISGTIPPSLGSHTALVSLNARSNLISGAIPSSLTGMGELSTLYLQDNAIEGTLPEPLSGLSSLRYLEVSRGRLSGTVPPAIGSLPLLQVLHLEANLLSGSLPDELTDLRILRTLRLADNWLDGEIPSRIGNLQRLEVLDIYNNSMVGDIPSSIRDLIELRELYLAHEHLLPLRKRYCGQRLPDLGKYSYRIVREEYDQMMASYCPEDQLHSTEFTFSTLQESGVYEQ